MAPTRRPRPPWRVQLHAPAVAFFLSHQPWSLCRRCPVYTHRRSLRHFVNANHSATADKNWMPPAPNDDEQAHRSARIGRSAASLQVVNHRRRPRIRSAWNKPDTYAADDVPVRWYDCLVDTGEARLGIDYGTASTVAVLAWPDGRYVPVLFDGAPLLPSAVHVDAHGQIRTGVQAWQQAATMPDGFEPAPLRRITEGDLMVGSRTVAVLDLIATTLRRVVDEAQHLAGAPPGEVRMVVPAGWGPRRRTLLRQAAHRAGLPQPTLVEAPVAVAERLLATGTAVPVGNCLAVADFGAGFEATVLRRVESGFEVLATVDAPDAGGVYLDAALAEHLTAMVPAAGPDPPTANPWPLRDSVRIAKESLSHASGVLVPMPPPHPAIVLNAAQLADLAGPILQPAAVATRQAIEAAEVPAEQLSGVYCVGGGAQLPQAAALLRDGLHLAATVVPDPQRAAALGAVHATTAVDADQAPAPPPEPGPPIRRALGILIPGIASIVLVAHAYLSAHYEPGAGGNAQYAYVQANWGELAMAAVFAIIASLTAATLIAAAALPPVKALSGQTTASAVPGAQIGTGLLAAAALGLAVAGLYTVTGAIYFGLPNGPFLRWALLPPLPIAAIAATAALLITRLHRSPAGSWDRWLAFPSTSILCAAAGMFMIQFSLTAPMYPTNALLNTVIGHGGGLLLGVGAALALARSTTFRIIIAAPLAMFTALIAGYPATGVLGVIYATAAIIWWSLRILHLLRR